MASSAKELDLNPDVYIGLTYPIRQGKILDFESTKTTFEQAEHNLTNLLLTQSYRLADASLVTPIKYLSLVFAIVFGFLIWSEVPKVLTLFGALLVVLSSLIIFVREKQLKKQIISPRT